MPAKIKERRRRGQGAGDALGTVRQLELFVADRRTAMMKMPDWPDLPLDARAALTRLMTTLILEHAAQDRVGRRQEAGDEL
jgi:hypothetical protein